MGVARWPAATILPATSLPVSSEWQTSLDSVPEGGVVGHTISPGRGGGAAAVRGEGRLEEVEKTCDKTGLSERLETC